MTLEKLVPVEVLRAWTAYLNTVAVNLSGDCKGIQPEECAEILADISVEMQLYLKD